MARHGHVDDARIDGANVVVAEPQTVHDVGTIVFKDDVADGAELQEDVAAGVPGEVEREAVLIAVVVVEVRRPVVPVGLRARDQPKAAELVPLSWGFDLDDLGAVIAEHACAERSGPNGREVDDAHPFKRGAHGALTSVASVGGPSHVSPLSRRTVSMVPVRSTFPLMRVPEGG